MKTLSAWRNALAVAAVLVGAVIGAGFASGRELWQFFGAYGSIGLAGTAAAGCGFGAAGAAVVAVMRRSLARPVGDRPDTWRGAAGAGYAPLLRALPRFLAPLVDFIIAAFLLVGLAVVLAGGGALASEQWHLPFWVGVGALAVPAALVLLMRERGFVAANTILTPLLVVLIVAVGVRALWATATPIPGGGLPPSSGGSAGTLPVPWWWAATLYVAYNMIVGAVALSSLESRRLQSAGVWAGVLAGGLLLGALAFWGVLILVNRGPTVGHFAVPLGAVAHGLGGGWFWLYSLSMYAALLTTALANAFGLASRFPAARPLFNRLLPCVFLVVVMPATRFGLAALVRGVYPVAGYASLLLLLALGTAALRPR